jgi:hypothetical protein
MLDASQPDFATELANLESFRTFQGFSPTLALW